MDSKCHKIPYFLIGAVWIGIIASAFFFLSLFFSSRVSAFLGDKNHYSRTKNIKNRFHGTIHTFKNYFVTVFSVFSFSKNELYPNGLIVSFKMIISFF